MYGKIKIPKSGKVKKGWVESYMVFDNNELRYWSSEDSYNSGKDGKLICSLVCEIFVARSVSQNEVIHASSKDVEKIFKIQSDSSLEFEGLSPDIDEKEVKLEKIRENIELEEKMLAGVTKILSLTNDAQKLQVIGQIDSANSRLRAFRAELASLEKTTKVLKY